MRLPGKVDSKEKIHFLTDYYITNKFHLKTLPFNNGDGNAWLKFYGDKKIRIKGEVVTAIYVAMYSIMWMAVVDSLIVNENSFHH